MYSDCNVQVHGVLSNEELSLTAEMFRELREIGWDGVGVTRESYGPGENAAFNYVAEIAKKYGLNHSFDSVGNLVVFDGPSAAAGPIVLGSHLDSVPQGGNFDGAAGVLAGLLLMMRFKRSGTTPPRPLWLMALRAEESPWFGRPNLGSHALFGLVSQEDLRVRRRGTGETLEEAMSAVGVDVSRIRDAEILLDPKQVAGYLELHIEQGPVLVADDLPVGIVTGIRGNVRHNRVVCRGESGHSGAVPRELRRDAVLAFTDLALRMERLLG